jgi:hypothetical protein
MTDHKAIRARCETGDRHVVCTQLMNFSRRNRPPRPRAGVDVPAGVRRGLIEWLRHRQVTPSRVGDLLLKNLGYVDWTDAAVEIEQWYGRASSALVHQAIQSSPTGSYLSDLAVSDRATRCLSVVPTDLFLTALECVADDWRSATGTDPDFASRVARTHVRLLAGEVNRVFGLRGVEFRMDEGGRIEWRGDEGAHALVVAPALAALEDVRLDGARGEFEASLAHLRVGTDKQREDAVEEAAKSVESAMKVALAAHGTVVEPNSGAARLFDALKGEGLVDAYTEYPLRAAAQIRNRLGGHGSGETPRTISERDAELCVRAAAVSIVYLAAILRDARVEARDVA